MPILPPISFIFVNTLFVLQCYIKKKIMYDIKNDNLADDNLSYSSFLLDFYFFNLNNSISIVSTDYLQMLN